MTSGGSPLVSRPKTKASSSRKAPVSWRTPPLVVIAKRRRPASAVVQAVVEDARELVIVETGPPQRAVFPAEAERLDQVQFGAGVGAQADHVARVGRDFGLE